jgi:hypothetical protein
MAIALERLCTSLQLPNGDLTEEIMAMKIVAVVKQGLRDPDEIFERIIYRASGLVLWPFASLAAAQQSTRYWGHSRHPVAGPTRR